MNRMQKRQAEIAQALQVVPPFTTTQALELELNRRIHFIASTLHQSGLKTLVLGISGGIDSTLAGRMSQLAVEHLRNQTKDNRYAFIAMRLPYQAQQDEADAQAALAFIAADEIRVVNIATAVQALATEIQAIKALSAEKADFVRGNMKARIRMAAQFAAANANAGLVIGTDHAAEAVMGFFTKFGDGACDLAPLAGLVKNQIRAMASHLGASHQLIDKTPTADLEELSPLQPDETAYGITYEAIDSFLHGHTVSDAVYQRIVHAYDASQHKREMPKIP